MSGGVGGAVSSLAAWRKIVSETSPFVRQIAIFMPCLVLSQGIHYPDLLQIEMILMHFGFSFIIMETWHVFCSILSCMADFSVSVTANYFSTRTLIN
jgi:hypothetical protein